MDQFHGPGIGPPPLIQRFGSFKSTVQGFDPWEYFYGATSKKNDLSNAQDLLLDLKQRVLIFLHNQQQKILHNVVFDNMVHRVNFIIRQEGGYFEHLIH